MAITNLEFSRRGRMQFQGVFETVVEIEALYDPPSTLSNGFAQESFNAPGVKFGDMVLVSFAADLLDLLLSAHVDAVDSLNVHIFNPSAGTVDLPEGQLHIVVLRPMHRH